jgi:hypothetical protein
VNFENNYFIRFLVMKRIKNKKKNNANKIANFVLQGSYPRMVQGMKNLDGNLSEAPQLVTLDLPLNPFQSSIVAGNMTFTNSIDANDIANFTSRYGGTFLEFRIIGARFNIRPPTVVTSPSGTSVFFIDEKLFTAPTTSQSLSRPCVEIPNVVDTSGSIYTIKWKAQELEDMAFTPTSTPTAFIPFAIKAYTDTSAFASLAATACTFYFRGAVRIQFRSLV